MSYDINTNIYIFETVKPCFFLFITLGMCLGYCLLFPLACLCMFGSLLFFKKQTADLSTKVEEYLKIGAILYLVILPTYGAI